MKAKKQRMEYIGFILPLLLALICLISVTGNHHQAFLPIPMRDNAGLRVCIGGEDFREKISESVFLRWTRNGWQFVLP